MTKFPKSRNPIVGKSEIARRLGVGTSTVDYWRAHSDFPVPASVASVAQGGPGSYPVWMWTDVERWATTRDAKRGAP